MLKIFHFIFINPLWFNWNNCEILSNKKPSKFKYNVFILEVAKFWKLIACDSTTIVNFFCPGLINRNNQFIKSIFLDLGEKIIKEVFKTKWYSLQINIFEICLPNWLKMKKLILLRNKVECNLRMFRIFIHILF